MKNVVKTFRDEMHQKPGAPLIKSFCYEAALIKTLFVLIVSTNNQPSISSLYIALGAAIYCSLPLMFAAGQIGLEVKGDYYNLPSCKRTIFMNLIKPYVIKVEKEPLWYQGSCDIMENV